MLWIHLKLLLPRQVNSAHAADQQNLKVALQSRKLLSQVAP